MLAIGRALMSRPRLLLLDEPSLGLAPDPRPAGLRDHQGDQRAGTTILLVEQNALQALTIAHRGYVLQTGDGRPVRRRGRRSARTRWSGRRTSAKAEPQATPSTVTGPPLATLARIASQTRRFATPSQRLAPTGIPSRIATANVSSSSM